MKCLLHIGTEKVGTMIIQDWQYHSNADSIEDALALMRIAHKQRPHGTFIKNKVEEWSDILNKSKNE